MEEKIDMSGSCEFKYMDMWMAANQDCPTISQEEFNKWYDNNCGKCEYMHIICMYGEE